MTTVFPDAYIDDSAYDEASWNGDGYTAPSRNAVRDLTESIKTLYALKTYVDNAISTAVTGLLDDKGPLDCSANPNYPAGSKGDAYHVTVSGKIGGASGVSVDVGDVVACSADNAGGTQAAVGASWYVLEHNLAGALLAANNLSDVANALTALTNLGGASPTGTGGLARADSPTFTTLLALVANGLAATVTDGTAIKACNATPATAGVPAQYSPAVLWEGQCWETAGGTTQSVKYRVIIQPVSGSTSTFNVLHQRSINGGAYTTFATFGSNGAGTFTNIVSAGSYLTTAGFCQVGAAQYFQIENRLRLQASASGVATLTRSDGTTPAQLTCGSVVRKRQDYSPAAATTASLLCLLSDKHRIQMPAGNITIAFSSIAIDQTLVISIKQDSTGSRTVTWPAGILWAGGSAPTLTTTASKTDTIIIECTAAGVYEGYVAGANI